MEEQKKSIFRKQALSKVSTPEELDKYLVVTRPGVWFALAAIIVLVVGVIAWAALGHLDTNVNIAVYSDGENTVCYVPAESAQKVLDSGKIVISDTEYDISDVGHSPTLISADTAEDVNIILAGQGTLSVGQMVQIYAVNANLSKGVYTGTVTVESVKPISFILN